MRRMRRLLPIISRETTEADFGNTRAKIITWMNRQTVDGKQRFLFGSPRPGFSYNPRRRMTAASLEKVGRTPSLVSALVDAAKFGEQESSSNIESGVPSRSTLLRSAAQGALRKLRDRARLAVDLTRRLAPRTVRPPPVNRRACTPKHNLISRGLKF